MNKIEQTVNELLEMFPELDDGKINNVLVLMELGFEPLPPRTGCGSFFEWYRELKIGISIWKLNVILDRNHVEASAFNMLDGANYFCNGCSDVPTALKLVLEKVKGMKEV